MNLFTRVKQYFLYRRKRELNKLFLFWDYTTKASLGKPIEDISISDFPSNVIQDIRNADRVTFYSRYVEGEKILKDRFPNE